ncbi:putative extracellular serine-rich protein [Histoplasma capsulatum]|uniref:Putative extracellular serine-rich protein n=1 Tax=Ajellomyces capsulatus TaxID=5037 RepID=A0A8A1MGR0_AJECA|nr:predicted protein [Histoplasma mississippiense (nom. inval.)]EDN05595.1 predicted protein [Histoplasma mississippiense (nom. inval.)]QSS65119.1 putative extracellular serine-rich protein [Histoplasma capsulatum]
MLLRGVLASTVFLATGIYAQVEDEVIAGWAPTKRQSPEGMVTVHAVQVGNAEGSKRFYPDSLKAEPGSMVQFQFHPANHSVAQSTFDNPCSPIGGGTGIRSGFLPVSADATEMPVFTIMINDNSPVWLFCGQKNHCQNGMVMVINPPEAQDKNIEAFRSIAMSGEGGSSGGGSEGGDNPIPLPTGGSLPTGGIYPTPGSNGGSGIALPSDGSISSTVSSARPTPTQTADPFLATGNAAPQKISHAATLSGLVIAAFAIFGL